MQGDVLHADEVGVDQAEVLPAADDVRDGLLQWQMPKVEFVVSVDDLRAVSVVKH